MGRRYRQLESGAIDGRKKMQKKIQIFIRQYHMIEKGDRIVIGVSGGADSVCLLMALCSLQEKLGFQVLVCHVNHELRGEEAAQDEAYVEMLCHKMQVPFLHFMKMWN